MKVASEIRAEMAREQIRTADLAQKTGMSVSSIQRKVMRESRGLYTEELVRIGEQLGVPGWELLRRAQENQGRLVSSVEVA